MDLPKLNDELELEIAFQKRWRTYCMVAYSVTTIGTLLLTAATTILAAFSLSAHAAVCAAIATVLIGTEKSLMFREKWKLHLTIVTKLTALKRRLQHCELDAAQTVEQLNKILENYSSELPIAPREE